MYVCLQGCVEVGFPIGQRLVRQPVYKVDADVAEACLLCPGDGLTGLPGIVAAVEQPEVVVVERLHPHADAVEGQAGQTGQVRRGEVVGVGFQGDFRIGCQRPVAADGIEQEAEIFPA